MKNFYFNIQSKGGTGKSMLTYLQALKQEGNDKSAFVDLDAASHTSTAQLSFLSEKKRLFEIELLDEIKRIDREKFFKMIEGLSQTSFDTFYIDFGSSESEQLLQLMKMDFSIDELKFFEQEMNARFVLQIVMAGGTAYEPCFQYLKQMLLKVNGKFETVVFINEFSFRQFQGLIEELRVFAKTTKGLIKKIIVFGNIYTERQSGIEIVAHIKSGLGIGAYRSFASRTIIKKELAKI